MTEKLKPCPFCGHMELETSGYRDGWRIRCPKCTSLGGFSKNLEGAKDLWNGRTK